MQNTLYTADNLFILHGLNSESIDLIYLDPPFNSKRIYSAPIGSKASGSSFKDIWTWVDVNESYLDTLVDKYPALVRFIQSIGAIHSKAMMAYVTYIAQRIIEMHRVLKETGSLYLHCDPTASHYLKLTLDEIFGKNNFRNEIVWCYASRQNSISRFNRKHDVLLFYSKSNIHQFNSLEVREILSQTTISKYKLSDENGRKYRLCGRGISGSPIKSAKDVDEKWEKNNPELTVRVYLDERMGLTTPDYWLIDQINQSAKERTGYPTQKPLALLHRIIKASSNEGDVVLDPFCGCATTCVAAQQLNRKWIGIDIEKQAATILIERLSNDAGMFKDFIQTNKIPERTDIKPIIIDAPIKNKLFVQQKRICNGCSNEFEIFNFEIDHVIPKSKGGGDYYENLQLLCGSCNRIKGNRPMEYLRMKIQKREELLKNKLAFGD